MVVLHGHFRRIVLEVSAPCESYVHVFRVAVSVDLPDAGHLHGVPLRVVVSFLEEVGRTLVGISHPVESPVALYGEIVCRSLAGCLEGSVARFVSEE